MSAKNTPASQTSQQYDIDADSEQSADEQPDEETAETEPLSLDLIFEVLKNRRRRDVIRYLRTQEERTSLGELAEHVAAKENDTTTKALTSSQRKRVYVGLYQCHLPKMDDMDIVDFNQDRGYVELGPNVEMLEPYLDPKSDDTHDWHRYYLGLSVFGVGAVAVAAALGTANPIGIAVLGLVVAGYLCTAAYHYQTESD